MESLVLFLNRISHSICIGKELGVVADIIVDAFYNSSTTQGWKPLYRLAELNRLQQNFPYSDPHLHQMCVAISTGTNQVVGFCDVDARPCPNHIRPPLPRPYLSDLSVHPDFRRRGIAKRLIATSETFLQTIPQTELYIRVEEANDAAVALYQSLNYAITEREPADKDKGIILVMRKSLTTTTTTATTTTANDNMNNTYSQKKLQQTLGRDYSI